MQDLATALDNCFLRDGTGLPTAALDFGGQDVSNMNSLTILGALSDANALILSKAGAKISIARSSDGAADSFIIGSAAPGSSVMSIKNVSGTGSEVQLDAGEIRFYNNSSVLRGTIDSAGKWKLPIATSGTTFSIANATAIAAGGLAGMGYCFSSTANFGVFAGSGLPTISAAKGSIYLRSDGSINARLYIATDSAGTWTAFNTAS